MMRPGDVPDVRDDLDRLLADEPTRRDTELVAALRAVRAMAQGPEPEPSTALLRVLAGGPLPEPAGSRLRDQAIQVEGRRRALTRGLLSLGLGAKIALAAGAAVALTGAALVDPVPPTVREPVRELISTVGDVVAPWGRGERMNHGSGDRGRPAEPTDDAGDQGAPGRQGAGRPGAGERTGTDERGGPGRSPDIDPDSPTGSGGQQRDDARGAAPEAPGGRGDQDRATGEPDPRTGPPAEPPGDRGAGARSP